MKKYHSVFATFAVLVTAVPVHAQLGVAARGGTLGFGVEAAVELTERIVVRGGVGLSNLDANTTFDGIAVKLALPDNWYTVGLDLYLNGAFRIGGGMLFKPDDPMLTGTFDGPVDIGGRVLTPSEIGTLTGRFVSEERAMYALLGFGKHTSRGIGLSLDVGAAFLGDPSVSLESEGGTFPDQAELDALLDMEARDFEDEMTTYLKVWPILNLGIRIGIG